MNPPSAGKTLTENLPASQGPAWGAWRLALTLFAVGWASLEVGSALQHLVGEYARDLDPGAAGLLDLFFYLAYLVGVALFLTGLALAPVVPGGFGARRPAWAVVASLAVAVAAWALYTGASFHNLIVVQDMSQRIRIDQLRNPKPKPPTREDLEQELQRRQWTQGLLRGLMLTAFGALGLAKVFYTGVLWAVARRLRREVLAGGLLIYLVAEVVGVSLALTVLARIALPSSGGRIRLDPFALFTSDWYAVAIGGAFAAWFLVNLVMVRRAITRALPAGA